jgi:hypothetical protein
VLLLLGCVVWVVHLKGVEVRRLKVLASGVQVEGRLVREDLRVMRGHVMRAVKKVVVTMSNLEVLVGKHRLSSNLRLFSRGILPAAATAENRERAWAPLEESTRSTYL